MMDNLEYREKYFKDFFQLGKKEVKSYILTYLSYDLANYQDEKLSQAIEHLDYSFRESISDSIYCLGWYECIIILEYLTEFGDDIEEIKDPLTEMHGDGSLLNDMDIQTSLVEVMRNWIYNGIPSMLYRLTDENLTVKENIEKVNKI